MTVDELMGCLKNLPKDADIKLQVVNDNNNIVSNYDDDIIISICTGNLGSTVTISNSYESAKEA